MITTKLNIHDNLPLTCSRTGTCCHGKQVWLNPWELVCLAKEKKITSREFRDKYCEFGGIRLQFNGTLGWKKLPACSQYIDNFGCSVHLGRPLSCRLYPLGRQIQSEKVQYIYQGKEFPCLEGCPEVSQLPSLSVSEYLKGQITDNFEKAQDEYLLMMQNLADIAFMFLLDTDLAASHDTKTLSLWRIMGSELPEKLSERIGLEWIDYLMLPDISNDLQDPASFAYQHYDLLQLKIQEKFGSSQSLHELHEASALTMGIALHLARSIGANPQNLTEYWIEIAKNQGAHEI